ncbi:transporter, partial [Marinobacter sp.]
MTKAYYNLRYTSAMIALLMPLTSHAFDVDPRDYTALPEGTNLNILYARQLTADDLNAEGETVTDDLDLDATIGIYRFVHFTKVMGLTVDPQFLLPFGTQEIGLLDSSSSGMGDAIAAATVWLHEDPEKKSYFGVTPFVIAPTGEYDSDKPVNLGANRWSYVLQAGYMTRLTEKLALDVVADVQWY